MQTQASELCLDAAVQDGGLSSSAIAGIVVGSLSVLALATVIALCFLGKCGKCSVCERRPAAAIATTPKHRHTRSLSKGSSTPKPVKTAVELALPTHSIGFDLAATTKTSSNKYQADVDSNEAGFIDY
jgi:hypothetical protein